MPGASARPWLLAVRGRGRDLRRISLGRLSRASARAPGRDRLGPQGVAWQRIDLGAAGLQAANLRLARLLKKRRTAYALLALFPFGLHRAYLEDRRGAALSCALTAGALASFATGAFWPAAALAATLVVGALLDLPWIECALARINKRLRIEVYLAPRKEAAPADRGRSPQEPNGGAEHLPAPPSFDELERQLRQAVSRGPRPGP